MKRLSLFALAASSALVSAAADPYAGYIYPAGIQAGTTNRFVVGGQGLRSLKSVFFDNPGLEVVGFEVVPGFPVPANGFQRKHLVKWLDSIAAGNPEEPPLPDDPHIDEWRSNSWWRVLGSLDEGKLSIVERDLFVPKNSLQATPSLRQLMLVTVAASPDAKPGWGRFMVVGQGGISAPRPFEVTAAPRAAEPLFRAPHRKRPEPTFVDLSQGGAVLDGQIMPGETDVFRLHLAANRQYVFSATARELQPYVGDAVPGFFNAALVLKDSQGRVVAKADDSARFRPDPVMYFTPKTEGDYTMEIHDVLYRGRADFVYSVAVNAPGPRLRYYTDAYARRFANVPPHGRVSAPGEVSRTTFTVDSPGPRVLEVVSRRRDSPLDAVLTLRKSAGGPELARWDDSTNTLFVGSIPQGECDPAGIYDFKESGEYVAEVTDRTGHWGKGYFYWLDVRKPKPSFEVYSTRSTLPLQRKNPLKVEFRVVRKDGFDGDVSIEFHDGIKSLSPCVVTSGTDRATAKLVYQGKDPAAMRTARISARAETESGTLRAEVVPCDEYEQAFAWRHLLPSNRFVINAPGRPAPKRRQP